MNQRKKISGKILKALAQCDGQPMPETALVEAVRILCRPDEPTQSEVRSCLEDLERDRFVQGASGKFTETTWTLTAAGTHAEKSI